ncbi:hypothetical protein ACFS07_12580 [Undibacterium arcticum]
MRSIRMRMNPHPAGQMTHNVPTMNEEPVRGLQHKYKQTVLFFPSSGQTCHAYCTFCFRWPQFVGMDDLKFDARESNELVSYLKLHPEVTDVLITGGDPLIMNTRSLAGYLEPLLAPELSHIQNIRIGTKSVAYWPQRFVTDKDADDLIELFKKSSPPAKKSGDHGPLQSSGRVAPGNRAAGRQAHRLVRRDAAHAGAADPPHQ